MNIKEAVNENQKSLKLFIENKMYIQASTPLRVLLCDNKGPLLLKLAEEQNKSLIVWTGTSCEEKSTTLLNGLQMELRLPCKWDPREVINRNKFSLSDFMDRKFCAAKDGNHYTPKQIIQATANKFGFTHFDTTDRQKYLKDSFDIKWIEILDNNSVIEKSLIDRHLLHLSLWTLEAIDYLNLEAYNFSFFLALDEIKNTLGVINIFCVQTGGLVKISFKGDYLLIQTKEKQIKIDKKNNSYLYISVENGEIKIISNLLDKNEIVPYSNNITSNSIKEEVNLNNFHGEFYRYGRLLKETEIQELTNKEIRSNLSGEINKMK